MPEIEVIDAEEASTPERTIAVRPAARPAELSINELTDQVRKIQAAMSAVMLEGEHYGVIPGTNKPSLLKPGAEKLCLLFRLDPEYEVDDRFDDEGHYFVRARCVLYHIPTGDRVASGMGFCSTRETKYAWRKQSRLCPACGAETIIKGKQEYGGGWVCFKKKGGCGAKFQDGDKVIEDQQEGRVPNEDLADSYNTVLKMSSKRALVAAVLNGTAASDIFTQDVEDLPGFGGAPGSAQPVQTPQTGAQRSGKTNASTVGADIDTMISTLDERWPNHPSLEGGTWRARLENHAEKKFGQRDLAKLTEPALVDIKAIVQETVLKLERDDSKS